MSCFCSIASQRPSGEGVTSALVPEIAGWTQKAWLPRRVAIRLIPADAVLVARGVRSAVGEEPRAPDQGGFPSRERERPELPAGSTGRVVHRRGPAVHQDRDLPSGETTG